MKLYQYPAGERVCEKCLERHVANNTFGKRGDPNEPEPTEVLDRPALCRFCKREFNTDGTTSIWFHQIPKP